MDELIVLIVFLSFCFAAFSFRRWRELSLEIKTRKDLEKKLLESEKKYKSIVENSLGGIQVYQDDKIVYANPKFAEIHGRTTVFLLKPLQKSESKHFYINRSSWLTWPKPSGKFWMKQNQRHE